MTSDAIEIRTLDEEFTAVVHGELDRDQLDSWRAFVTEQGNTPDGDGWEVVLDGDPGGRREVVQPYH